MKCSPDFIGIGVEKAATSWIFACLYEHPEICIPRKEVNFFSKEDLWISGVHWYETYFGSRCSDNKIKGEFSTEYFFNPTCPSRINSLYPNIKLIVCLRDPIQRAYSGYINAIKAAKISNQISFEEAIKADSNYLDQGKYKMQFNRYLQYFKQHQILILIYEDIELAPLSFIKKIYQFLNVDPTFTPSTLNEKINTSRVPENLIVEGWSNKIAAFLQQSKLGELLWWSIKKSKIPSLIRRVNTKKNELPKVSQKTYNDLKRFFEEDLIYIESLIGRKLNWLSEKNL